MIVMYNVIECSNNYLRTSGSLWQYHKDDPNGNMTNSESFKFKSRLNNSTNNAGILNMKIAVPLKYLSNFWNTLKMPFINCETNLMLTLNLMSTHCVICKADKAKLLQWLIRNSMFQ